MGLLGWLIEAGITPHIPVAGNCEGESCSRAAVVQLSPVFTIPFPSVTETDGILPRIGAGIGVHYSTSE